MTFVAACGWSAMQQQADRYVVDFPTLWVVPAWIERHCIIPDGFRKGRPFRMYDWQLWITANHYRIKPRARQDQAFLGPESGLAVPDGEGGVDIYVATQWLHVDRAQVAPCLDLDPAQGSEAAKRRPAVVVRPPEAAPRSTPTPA